MLDELVRESYLQACQRAGEAPQLLPAGVFTVAAYYGDKRGGEVAQWCYGDAALIASACTDAGWTRAYVVVWEGARVPPLFRSRHDLQDRWRE